MLTDIEHRLTWQPQRDLPLLARIVKVGSALLSLKEIEYLGQPQTGHAGRADEPADGPAAGADRGGVVRPRADRARSCRGCGTCGPRSCPTWSTGRVTPEERTRRWQQLADIYLAQQLSSYPPDYLARPTVDRVLEMIEKFEEDLTDKARLHGQLKVVLQIGEAIEVSPERDTQGRRSTR